MRGRAFGKDGEKLDPARGIALRNPYIDPIHRLQVELLRRARAEPQGLDALERPLLLSVQGIAAGVRNTG